LEIRFSDTQDGILNIFDYTIKLVYKNAVAGVQSLRIDVSALPSGLYWVQMPGFKTEMIMKR